MAQIKTQILLRNDSHENWELNKTVVLGKGELAIETFTDGKKKIKIGDGSTEWQNLGYYGAGEVLTGEGIPSNANTADVGALYIDTTSKKAYIYVDASLPNPWKQILTPEDIEDLGGGDMTKAVYATNGNDGVVDKTLQILDSTKDVKTILKVNDDATGDDTTDNNAIWTANKVKTVVDEKVAAVKIPEYTIAKSAVATEGYLASYELQKDGAPAGVKIDIPKDYLVKSAEIKESAGEEDPSTFPAGTKYIDFVINTSEDDGTEKHIYLNVEDLVDVYTAGDGVEIDPETNAIKVKLDAASANGLAVDASGLKLNVASGDAAGAMSSADYTKLQGIAAGAQVNVLEGVKIGEEDLQISDKKVTIPLATAEKQGLVKGSAAENQMKINEDGTIEVNTVNVNKLVQTGGERLIIDGGDSVTE